MLRRREPIGFEIPHVLAEFPGAVRVHAGRDSDFVREIVAPSELELALIDGSHKHPWPLLDLLRLARFVRGGGWVLLHDIQHGTLGEAMKVRGESSQYDFAFGAEWLFEAWPFRKISNGNIGAVQMPYDKLALLPLSAQMMRKPFETQPRKHRQLEKRLYRALSQLC